VHHSTRRTDQRLECPLNQVLTTLDQHLNFNIVGDHALFNDESLKIEVGLGRGRESDFNLFETNIDQGPEQRELAFGIHRVDQGLVAVPQVDTGPSGGTGLLAVGPGAVFQYEGDVRPVLAKGHGRRVTGQGQATPLHVVTNPFLFRGHDFFPFSVLPRCYRPNKKPPGRRGAGGCERTLCGVRRQVSSRMVAVNVTVAIVPSVPTSVKAPPPELRASQT